MSNSNVLFGSPVLLGDNTIPGVQYTPELEEIIPKVVKAVSDFGCDFYPPVVELLTYDEISEVAAYGGFPVRYPHWSFGMEYEQLQRGYEHGMHKIYEMVINTNPCYIYCLDSNPLIDHVTVIAHALGHSDFFKNNRWFLPTTENAMNELANHGSRIRRYIDKYGMERVQGFIDSILCVDELIDGAKAWRTRHFNERQVKDKKTYRYPRRLKLPETGDGAHEYMDPWVNSPEWVKREHERIKDEELREELQIFEKAERDILGFLVERAPLAPWQQDIIAMLYNESQYFSPQGSTKMMNEGWASYVDFNIMARNKWALGDGIVHYAKHKMGVLGGKYSMNPYAVGFKIFLHVEERWNKGRFGREYDQCQDAQVKAKWDKKLGLGHQKVFEIRETHNDVTAVREFVDQDFVDKWQLYVWKKFPNPDGGWRYEIESRDVKKIKKLLMDRYLNGGRPDIRLEDPNFGGRRIFFMQHKWDGRTLHPRYTRATLPAIWSLWNNFGTASRNPVAIASRNKDEKEIVYVCDGPREGNSVVMSRKDFEEKLG